MSDIISLGAARAARSDDASKVSIRDTLLSVIDEIDRGIISPKHIFIVSAFVHDDGDTQIQVNHSGPFDNFAQIGMLHSAAMMIAAPMSNAI